MSKDHAICIDCGTKSPLHGSIFSCKKKGCKTSADISGILAMGCPDRFPLVVGKGSVWCGRSYCKVDCDYKLPGEMKDKLNEVKRKHKIHHTEKRQTIRRNIHGGR